MLKSYFKMAWRAIVRNKVSSIINISGLAIGLATGIIILLVLIDEFNYDHFNKNLSDIRLVMKNTELNGILFTNDETPEGLASQAGDKIPEIKLTARTRNGGQAILKWGEKPVYLNSLYADPDFFNIMTLPAIKGNPVEALREPGSVILTQSASRKLFGNEDPIGKLILYNNSANLKVAALIYDVPQNSSNQFDIVLSFSLSKSANDLTDVWTNGRVHTWLQLKPHVNEKNIDSKLTAIIQQTTNEKKLSLFAYPFAKLNLYGKFTNGKPWGLIDFILILSGIAFLVLLIACLNYMNLATAISEQRAREIGIRKVLGAKRTGIILRFLGEALGLSFISLALGIVLAFIFLPFFMKVSEKYFVPAYSSPLLWTLLLLLGFTTGIVAGIYPAFYLSRFKPVKVLKKVMIVSTGGGMFRKGMVTFQFFISIFLVIVTIGLIKQVDHIDNRPVGYDSSNLIDIPISSAMDIRFNVLKNKLLAVNGVKAVTSGSDNLIFFLTGAEPFTWPGKTGEPDFDILSTTVGYDWTKTTAIQLLEGRDFDRQYGLDSLSCLVNEAAVKKMKLLHPIGVMLGKYTIIGVIQNFVFNNPDADIKPLVIHFGTHNLNHVLVRIANDDHWRQYVADIEQTVKQINPGFPFEFNFTKDNYQQNFKRAHSYVTMAKSSGAMAIFISCLGLYGLSAFLAVRRKKEMSIRKVLGSGTRRIWILLSGDLLKPILLAFFLATPLAGWVMEKLLQNSYYRILLSANIFIVTGTIIISVALLTISYNTIKVALDNPVKNLGAE